MFINSLNYNYFGYDDDFCVPYVFGENYGTYKDDFLMYISGGEI